MLYCEVGMSWAKVDEMKCSHGKFCGFALWLPGRWGLGGGTGQTFRRDLGFELKSLILAQIERWRHALHMQVERQHGGNPGGEWRTGE